MEAIVGFIFLYIDGGTVKDISVVSVFGTYKG